MSLGMATSPLGLAAERLVVRGYGRVPEDLRAARDPDGSDMGEKSMCSWGILHCNVG